MSDGKIPYYVPTAFVLKWEFVEKRPEDFTEEYNILRPKRKVGKPKGGLGRVKKWKPVEGFTLPEFIPPCVPCEPVVNLEASLPGNENGENPS